MKKLLMIAGLLLASAFAAFANDAGKKNKVQKTWAATAAYSSITIQGNLEVFLNESPETVIRVEGDAKSVNAVSFSVEDGRLIVRSKESFINGKTTVHIPVQRLQQLLVEGNVRLSSIGYLESERLRIRVAADCQLNIVSTGLVEIVSDEDKGYYFNVESRKRSVF